MQRNLVIYPAATSSSIKITEIDLGSALFAMQCNANFAYNNVFIALHRAIITQLYMCNSETQKKNIYIYIYIYVVINMLGLSWFHWFSVILFGLVVLVCIGFFLI